MFRSHSKKLSLKRCLFLYCGTLSLLSSSLHPSYFLKVEKFDHWKVDLAIGNIITLATFHFIKHNLNARNRYPALALVISH
jgi:hypothetical protein